MIKRLGLVMCFMISSVPAAAGENFTPVTGEPFVANYSPGNQPGTYGVIVLEGSRGGLSNRLASKVAGLGYPVLSLAYFRESGLPPTLEKLPLEYFDAPRQWLSQQPETRSDGVVLLGWSKGAELALLLASNEAEYVGVAAIAPSSVVWSARRSSPQDIAVSSWSRAGKGVNFVPLNEAVIQQEGLLSGFVLGLEHTSAVSQARIPVERIAGPVLLLSGEDDQVWPAARMAEQICAQMSTDTCQHVRYPGAGHLLDPDFNMGGTADANAAAEGLARDELARFLRQLNGQLQEASHYGP
ncbi:acyl-CoA thioester hydrolase/BAAT C-terminal domain-containing protein [Marinobacterium marinum]|uniref:Dienelactone hydrolase family protein n=1 Tax=Marinobacterium marinum TaxID=2756129 RepID=A0A7W1WYA0_9GAMM|nr:acyl-CoA thioester hydrolase/BAAT C-terminal domain-containing protein [Marinobacterium marinum]MBA4502311.1 dienelactone hydrolase family protein [Marinobacterium marinum]